MNKDELLLDVKNLKTHFFLDEGTVRAVDGVDMQIHSGETLGVVGESGCGKSITARSVMRILAKSGRIVEGDILFRTHRHEASSLDASVRSGELVNLAKVDGQSDFMRSVRGSEISMVFQEPMTSLSPVHSIGDQIMEAIILHQKVSKTKAKQLATDMLNLVGMPLPTRTVDRYPHQLSGGMRQRAMIAMALSCRPSLLIADEPTTALDVTTEAQILSLMRRLQKEFGMAIMFITHNLGVIAQMTENVVVMYMGKIVEAADVDTLFYDPQHPYTRALLQSIPRLGQKSTERRRLASIRGTVPDPYSIPNGCPFHPRCDLKVRGVCDQKDPPNVQVSPNHAVRCIHAVSN